VRRRRGRAPGGLAGAQLIVVTGKGGVGKTTVAAALARLLASRDRDVVLLELDAREPLHRLLGVPPSAGEAVPAGPGLHLLNLRPQAVMEALVRDRLKIALLARRVIANPVFRHFVDGAPGMKELAVLGHSLRMVRREVRPHADVVIVDAPATGHGVQLLAAPALVAEAIGRGPLGKLAGQVAEFVGDQERTAVVVTALAEEMPVQEALELLAMLRERLGRTPDLVAVNGLYPPFPTITERGTGNAERGAVSRALELWRQRRAMNEREVARLTAAWQGPLAQIPLMTEPPGPALVARVGEALAAPLAPAGRR
jgi:anion-transporting  ArsA/GET3 family ATPase